MPHSSIDQLLSFLDSSPTAWHAVDNMSAQLSKEGFQELKEGERWNIKAGGRYWVARNGSSLCAFIVPTDTITHANVVLSHTDSPGFKLKPNAEFRKENMIMWGMEVYGAPLMASWLNRDLGVAGRVVYLDGKKKQHETLVRLDDSPVVLPQLAIHLDRNVNETGLVLHKQEHLSVIAALTSEANTGKSYLEQCLKDVCDCHTLLGYDLFLFPLEPAKYIGPDKQMIASYRIDNLCSAFASLTGMLKGKKSEKHILKMIASMDNEEIGSETAQGTASPFLAQVIERVTLALNMSREDYLRIFSESLCISADLAHATHPNYNDRHEARHPIYMERGIVIKHNSQHKYASDARSTSAIAVLCKNHNIPFQHFVTKGDMPCGSTVGPIHAHRTGMPTVDIGIAQLSMHSCRELAASKDYNYLVDLLTVFFGT